MREGIPKSLSMFCLLVQGGMGKSKKHFYFPSPALPCPEAQAKCPLPCTQSVFTLGVRDECVLADGVSPVS